LSAWFSSLHASYSFECESSYPCELKVAFRAGQHKLIKNTNKVQQKMSSSLNAQGCINFRDVSASLAALGCVPTAQTQLPLGKIFRGGKIDDLSLQDIGNPRTIVNLRQEQDNEVFKNVKYLSFPKDDELDVYKVQETNVRKWLLKILRVFQEAPSSANGIVYPVLIHCRKGKDRTGILVATLLFILGLPNDVIVQEFGKSEGIGDKEKQWVAEALDFFKNKCEKKYWSGLDFKKIAANLRGALVQ